VPYFDWATRSSSEIAEWTTRRYFEADFDITGGQNVDLQYGTVVASDGAVSIANSWGVGRFGIRRNWDHIRRGSEALYTIVHPLSREIHFIHNGISDSVRPGEFVILSSDRPLYMKSFGDNEHSWRGLILRVPAISLQSVLPQVQRIYGRKFTLDNFLGSAAIDVLLGILETSSRLSDEKISRFLLYALDLITESIRARPEVTEVEKDLPTAHYERVMRCVRQHLGSHGLTVAKTAKSCGISPRYLQLVMSRKGTTFTDALRTERLGQAHAWLKSSDSKHIAIEEVSRLLGFRQPSHFSRLYKAQFGRSPRETRSQVG
jgi:AraC-like DNA-binding protein